MPVFTAVAAAIVSAIGITGTFIEDAEIVYVDENCDEEESE